MTDSRAAITRWFDTPRPVFSEKAFIGVVAATLFGLVLMNNHAAGPGILLILVVAGVTALRYRRHTFAVAAYQARPSVVQMTDWLAGDINRIRDASLGKCGLDHSQVISQSGVIAGPVFWDEKGLGRQATSRRRAVNEKATPLQYLYGCWELHAFHFGQGMLMLYSCAYDWYSHMSMSQQVLKQDDGS